LDDTAKSLIPHVRVISLYGDTEYLGIDESSQRNLELIRNLRDGDIRFSLLEVMDETRTAMGRRLLKRRLLHPLRDAERINKRLDMVETLYRDQGRLGAFRDLLGKMPDLERLCSRLAMDRAHGKDMVSIKNALFTCESIENLIQEISRESALVFENSGDDFIGSKKPDSGGAFTRLITLRKLLEKSLAEDPSILLTEGNLIRDGFDKKLDELRLLKDNGRQLLGDYLEEEREATGISSLKIRYNRLIGYFFEVTKVQLSKVPPRFIRRQGIANGERFTTDRLAALESEINGASDKIIELEKQLFLEIREKARACVPELSAAAWRVAEMDTAQSLARSATIQGWARPRLDTRNFTRIIEGRHPVVEAHLPRGEFIPNDALLDGEGVSFALITGPNMAGKSTYLRQTALITIMAQIGSLVPAREADIGLVDRIYCRVGASDNLARGESTFLMEMNETAYILHTATEKSLVIMDEVGRGTGTNDGLSIAWAVSEELLDHTKCRTLFATHYHELSGISHPRMANRSMEVLDHDGELVFLRKLREGPSAESYGLHVARLAGLPERVLVRAGQVMERLRELGRTLGETRLGDAPLGEPQLSDAPLSDAPLSDAPLDEERGTEARTDEARPGDERMDKLIPADVWQQFIQDLSALKLDHVTPLEALNLIHAWKRQFAGEGMAQVSRGNIQRGSQRNKAPQGTQGPSLFD
jgi:DNA mismatch repair protein MutS